jgi:SAM-dependent methyltransferase
MNLLACSASIEEFEEILLAFSVERNTKILDTCAGSGSLDIDLLKRGYSLTLTDGDAGMVDLLKRGLTARSLKHEPMLARWGELPGIFAPSSFGTLICAGNSLIYGGGYWNYSGVVDWEKSLDGIRSTLKIFHDLLAPGGVLIVDKPKDDECAVEERIAQIAVAEERVLDVFFSVRFDEADVKRTAQILLRDVVTGEELGTPNAAIRFFDEELIRLAHDVGFAKIEKVERAESQFPLWVLTR